MSWQRVELRPSLLQQHGDAVGLLLGASEEQQSVPSVPAQRSSEPGIRRGRGGGFDDFLQHLLLGNWHLKSGVGCTQEAPAGKETRPLRWPN